MPQHGSTWAWNVAIFEKDADVAVRRRLYTPPEDPGAAPLRGPTTVRRRGDRMICPSTIWTSYGTRDGAARNRTRYRATQLVSTKAPCPSRRMYPTRVGSNARHCRRQRVVGPCRNDTSIRSPPLLTSPLGNIPDRPAPDVPRYNRTSHTSVTEMKRRTEVSATGDPSIDTRTVPPRAVRNHGRILCRAAMMVPLGAARSSSKPVTAELAADALVKAGPGLVCGIDDCPQPVNHPMLSHAANGDLIVASHVV